MTVIGIGNPERGDDAVGLIAVRRLKERRPEIPSFEQVGDPLQWFDRVSPNDRVVVVDAVVSGAQPGSIHRFDASDRPLPILAFRGSTHAMCVAEAVELARTLGRLPAVVVFYGVEGSSFAHGAGLSPPVAGAIDPLVDCLIQEVDGHA